VDAPQGAAPEGRIRRLRRRFRPRTRPRFEGQSFNRLIPNILTMLGLCCGLVAIRAAFEGRFAEAAVLIVVAGVIDGLDGRLARLLKATSRFGAEFDSLADFLSFGVAPALVLYLWAMQDYRGIAFAPALLFAVCSALRLARFNATLDVGPAPKPAFTYNFFTGVPAPAGAGCARGLTAGADMGCEW
jgi:CDP-diacylglycerol--serine O-phosphatidyltransferase